MLGPVATHVMGDLTATCWMTHDDDAFKVQKLDELSQIVSVCVHVVARPGLARATVATTVMSDDTVSLLAKKEHLRVPVVGGEWPAVGEEDRGRTLAPVFVEELSAILSCEKMCMSQIWEINIAWQN